MQKSSKTALTIAATLVLVLLAFFLVHRPQPSDPEQIVAQMERARAAAARSDTGGMMKVISADYKGNSAVDSNVDTLHFMLARSLGQARQVVVTLSPPHVQIQGDTASSTSHLTVRSDGYSTPRYDSDITLHWKRESGYRLLVVPTPVWRIVKADFPTPEE